MWRKKGEVVADIAQSTKGLQRATVCSGVTRSADRRGRSRLLLDDWSQRFSRLNRDDVISKAALWVF
jgi:hypothetical protein